MFWKLWTSILLLAWLFCATNPIQAARITNLDLVQNWEPQTQMNSDQADYPSYMYVKNSYPRGGYNRRRRLPARGKAAAQTTTERPFYTIWNNFVRSVQPNFGFRNLTNPFTNFFTNGNTNIIESVPVQVQVQNDDKEQQLLQGEELGDLTDDTTKRPKKNKRKRRKQQKRISVPVEQNDQISYYGNTFPISALAPQQPMYYYDPAESYYDMRRLHDYHFYNPYFNAEPPIEQEEPEHASDTLGKLNTKTFTVLRPLRLAIKMPIDNENDQNAANGSTFDTTANEDVNDSTVDIGIKAEESISSTASHNERTSLLPESMRNALGTYMSDDWQTRQRQRQSERQPEVFIASKEKPRHGLRYFFAARLVKTPKDHQ